MAYEEFGRLRTNERTRKYSLYAGMKSSGEATLMYPGAMAVWHHSKKKFLPLTRPKYTVYNIFLLRLRIIFILSSAPGLVYSYLRL